MGKGRRAANYPGGPGDPGARGKSGEGGESRLPWVSDIFEERRCRPPLLSCPKICTNRSCPNAPRAPTSTVRSRARAARRRSSSQCFSVPILDLWTPPLVAGRRREGKLKMNAPGAQKEGFLLEKQAGACCTWKAPTCSFPMRHSHMCSREPQITL